MKRKNGITISSLVLYLTLLFIFVAVATAVSKKFEFNAFEQKAFSINMENYSRLVASLNISANNADEIVATSNTITFYEGGVLTDKYTFDTNGKVYKNDILVTADISNFNISKETVDSTTTVSINLEFIKYSVTMIRDIVICV